jgi:hypothetical protein
MSSPLGLHSFKGGVAAGSLSSAVNNSVTTFPINTIVVANWPPLATGPFKIVIDQGLPTEESCLVTAATTTSFTVTRAYDGSTAYAHANGATFYTAPEAEAMQDVAQHVYDTTRNDHTQYVLEANLANGYGISGFAGTSPTPAVGLAALSGTLSGNVTLTGSTAVTGFTTVSLAIGTWLVVSTLGIGLPANTGGINPNLSEGSAIATFAGSLGAGVSVVAGMESGGVVLTFATLVTVTSAGTIKCVINNTCTDNGTLFESGYLGAATGYVAIRIA